MNHKKLKRLNIELSSHCSYTCVGCPNTYMKRKKGHMSLELFKQIYNEVENKIEEIFLWNYGEPLLNPDISEIISYTKNKSPRTILSTTGKTLLKRKDVSFLGYLDELIISINGLDNETYAFHQKKGDLNEILLGLERIKNTMNTSKTNYILQIVINSRNVSQINQVEEFAKKFGFNKVVFKSFNVMDGKKETEDKFVPKGTSYSRGSIKNNSKKYPCNEWMVINWNGDVNICCWDYEGEIVISNVENESVIDSWDDEKMNDLKNKINTEKIFSYCGSCTVKTTIDELVIE